MNAEIDLKKRLLGMLPASTLKAHFGVAAGKKEDVVADRAQNLTKQACWDAAFDLFSSLKQHVFMYAHASAVVPNINSTLIQNATLVRAQTSGGALHLDHIIELSFQTTILNLAAKTISEPVLKFYWPVRVTISPNLFFVAASIIEKDLKVHLGNGVRVITAKRSKDETAVVAEAIVNLPQNLIPTALNFDKGIKKLWNDGAIDTPHISFKDSSSTRTESMDTGSLFKDKYPTEYAKIVSKPLLETLFVSIDGAGDDYPPLFKVEPSQGQMSFAVYPRTDDAIANVIREILSNN